MVTISGIAKRINSQTNDEFLVMLLADTSKAAVKTSAQGNMYIDCPTASLPWYRTEEEGNLLKGKTLPGSLENRPCDPWVDRQGNTQTTRWTYVAA